MDIWMPIVIAVIAAIPPTLVAWAALRKSAETAKSTQEIHLQINSRMDELLQLTEKASKAEGVEQERMRALTDTPPHTTMDVHMVDESLAPKKKKDQA